MNSLQEMERLAAELEQAVPGVRTELDAFPSGGVMLDVFRDGRAFTMAYFPSYPLYCVDEIPEIDDPNNGLQTAYRFGDPDFEAAREELRRLMGLETRERHSIDVKTAAPGVAAA